MVRPSCHAESDLETEGQNSRQVFSQHEQVLPGLDPTIRLHCYRRPTSQAATCVHLPMFPVLPFRQAYLKALEAAVQTAVSSAGGGTAAQGARALASAAIRCMCGLLSAHPHFNFRSNLVRTVVAGTNHKLVEVREACCECLGGVFSDDVQGEVSLEVTKAVAKFIKERK